MPLARSRWQSSYSPLIIDHCAARPTVLVIDDTQWADQASVQLLGLLARLARQAPLLLIAIMRPVPQRDDLAKLRRAQNDALHLAVAPLPGWAVAELVAALVGGAPDDALVAIAGDAAGNPLYLTELVEALRRGPGIAISAARVATLAADPLLAGPVPRSLAAAVASRLTSCPPRSGTSCGRQRCSAWSSRCGTWRSSRAAACPTWPAWFTRHVQRACWPTGRPACDSGTR